MRKTPQIPGLSFIPDDDDTGGIEIKSFSGTYRVPRSHINGSCRSRTSFQKLAKICDGTFGPIYKCRFLPNNEICTLKNYVFTPEMMADGVPYTFLNHINILYQLKHDNIVNFFGVVAGPALDNNFLMLDFCNTTLKELMEKKTPAIYERDVMKYIMKNLFEGLGFIHENLIVHRNIICKNIFFTDTGLLKISGFRTAVFYCKNNMPPVETDLTYQAPELLFGAKDYDLPIDVWSAGCIFAKLLLKKPLFSGKTRDDVMMSMMSILGSPSEAIWPEFSSVLKKGTDDEKKLTEKHEFSNLKNILAGTPVSSSQLLQSMLIYYPTARITAVEVLQSSYIVTEPKECSLEKMASIVKNALCSSELLDIPMEVCG